MTPRDLSILVVGAGGIGGITAAILKKEGYNVEIMAKYPEYAEMIENKGLNITGVKGSFIQKMKAWSKAVPEIGKKDIILHATKATDMIEAAKEVLPFLKDDGIMVSLQNGMCEETLAGVCGNSRIAGCVVAWGATMNGTGILFMSSTGEFVIGYPDGHHDNKLDDLATILESVVPVRISPNITGHLFAKMIINSCITLPGAITGLHVGEMLKRKKIRKIFIEIMKEAMAVSVKMGIKVEKFGDKLDFYKVVEKEGWMADMKRHLLMRFIGFKYRRLRSSSLQSLERGKPTEVDYFNGYISSNARKYGVETPVNDAIVRLIHEIEAGKRKIAFSNFSDPSFNRFD